MKKVINIQGYLRILVLLVVCGHFGISYVAAMTKEEKAAKARLASEADVAAFFKSPEAERAEKLALEKAKAEEAKKKEAEEERQKVLAGKPAKIDIAAELKDVKPFGPGPAPTRPAPPKPAVAKADVTLAQRAKAAVMSKKEQDAVDKLKQERDDLQARRATLSEVEEKRLVAITGKGGLLEKAEKDLRNARIKVGAGVAAGVGGVAIAGTIAGVLGSVLQPDTGAAGAAAAPTTSVTTVGTTEGTVAPAPSAYAAATEEAAKETDEELLEEEEEPVIFGEEEEESSEEEEEAAFVVEGGEAKEEEEEPESLAAAEEESLEEVATEESEVEE